MRGLLGTLQVPLIRLELEDGLSHQVEGQAIIGEDDDKEDDVDQQVQHVCDQLQVEDIDALVLPASLHVIVHH